MSEAERPEKQHYLCPVCCEKKMVITHIDGKHYFVCENCGTKRGPLPSKGRPEAPEE